MSAEGDEKTSSICVTTGLLALLNREETQGVVAEVYQNPKSWIMTGTKGMFTYPREIEENQGTGGHSLSGAFKIVLQSLVRMVPGI